MGIQEIYQNILTNRNAENGSRIIMHVKRYRHDYRTFPRIASFSDFD